MNSKPPASGTRPTARSSPRWKSPCPPSRLFSSKPEAHMAEIGEDVFFATIPELNARLKDKAFSAEDLARAFAKRLADLGPRYNALALPLNQEAIRRAKEVDKELKRGRFRGPLQGIPYGVKDLLSYKGQPTTWGAQPYAGQVFDYDATVISRLSGVGAVVVGKLSTVELAGGGGYRFASASLQGPGK